MAIYLREDEVGHDPNSIGFPTLGSCMGLAVVTPNGLYGFHMPPGHENRISAFPASYAGHNPTVLLSCCRFEHRYKATTGFSTFAKWTQEIKIFARAIGYRGRIEGVDLSAVLGGDAGFIADKTESAYCEYTLLADGSIKVGASLTSNTTSTAIVNLLTAIRRVKPDGTTTMPILNKEIISITPNVFEVLTEPSGQNGVYAFDV